jgi:hypothetical protein
MDATLGRTAPKPWIPALAYGLLTLLFLWGTGGGSWEVALPRALPVGLAALAMSFAALRAADLTDALKPREGGLRIALGAGVALFVPALVAIWLVRYGNVSWQPDLPRPGLVAAAAGGLLWASSMEILGRGLLQPSWGLGSVAFLDALTLGFGTQNFAVFVSTWLVSLSTGVIAKRFGLAAAVLVRVTWTFLTLLALALI